MHDDQIRFRGPVILLLATLLLLPLGALGQTCQVPDDRPTLQLAVDDSNCSTVEITISAIVENVIVSRSVSISGKLGAKSRVIGQMVISGSGVSASLRDLHVDTSDQFFAGCFDQALYVADNASVDISNVRISNLDGSGTCVFVEEVFANGFE